MRYTYNDLLQQAQMACIHAQASQHMPFGVPEFDSMVVFRGDGFGVGGPDASEEFASAREAAQCLAMAWQQQATREGLHTPVDAAD